jgi:dihydrofolate reductase
MARKLISHLLVTLDGVVNFGSVRDEIVKLRDREVGDDFAAKLAAEDAMLLGRVTYQEWAQFWPASKIEPFASHINRVSKYFVSHSSQPRPWGASGTATAISGDISGAISNLKEQHGQHIGVHGSPSLVKSLLDLGLLDELRLEIYPIVAGGGGSRLFEDGQAPQQMELIDSRSTKKGVVILTYRPRGG